MSDRSSSFGFSSNGRQQYQNRCTLCLTEDDRNVAGSTAIPCQHNVSVESALHYLRNYGAAYGQSAYYAQDYSSMATTPISTLNSCSPSVTSNYFTLAEFLLRMNRMQQENTSGHYVRPPPVLIRPSKPKSELGCLRECAFCKSNGETAEFYKSHFLKDPIGRVRCPILQRYDHKYIAFSFFTNGVFTLKVSMSVLLCNWRERAYKALLSEKSKQNVLYEKR